MKAYKIVQCPACNGNNIVQDGEKSKICVHCEQHFITKGL